MGLTLPSGRENYGLDRHDHRFSVQEPLVTAEDKQSQQQQQLHHELQMIREQQQRHKTDNKGFFTGRVSAYEKNDKENIIELCSFFIPFPTM